MSLILDQKSYLEELNQRLKWVINFLQKIIFLVSVDNALTGMHVQFLAMFLSPCFQKPFHVLSRDWAAGLFFLFPVLFVLLRTTASASADRVLKCSFLWQCLTGLFEIGDWNKRWNGDSTSLLFVILIENDNFPTAHVGEILTWQRYEFHGCRNSITLAEGRLPTSLNKISNVLINKQATFKWRMQRNTVKLEILSTKQPTKWDRLIFTNKATACFE